MRIRELKVARIGNSRGVRLPASSLKRYSVGSVMIMEERAEGILLRSAGPAIEKLNWEDTAREMAVSGEDWNEWDKIGSDGLESVPWEALKARQVRDKRIPYGLRGGSSKEIVKRYELRWAVLDPTRGAEMAKTRPVVIVSLDEMNARLRHGDRLPDNQPDPSGVAMPASGSVRGPAR